MNITNFLQGTMGVALIDGVAKRLGVNSGVARTAIAVGLPLLIASLSKNSKSKEGANGILGAVQNKHDGGILDNITDLFSNKGHEDDGNKILGHIFGSSKDDIHKTVSEKSGLSSGQTAGLMAILAPVVMGLVGKNANNQNTQADGLTGLLGSILTGGDTQQNEGNGLGSILDSFLDDDGDGSLDDIAEMGSKFLGGLLGK